MPIRFLTLEPDAALRELVLGYKHRTRELCGPQLYLDDPPHITAFLAAFPQSVRLLDHIASVLANTPPPRVRITGWHTFEADALTGLNTLVCHIHPDDKIPLRRLQERILAELAPHRVAEETERRLAPRLQQLTPSQRESVQRFGFPFTGDGWEPHLTIASIQPSVWPALLAEFSSRPPLGTFTCSGLAEYELVGITPRRLGTKQFLIT